MKTLTFYSHYPQAENLEPVLYIKETYLSGSYTLGKYCSVTSQFHFREGFQPFHPDCLGLY